MKKTAYLITALVLLLITETNAQTLIADFDSFEEGYNTTTLVDGGITFSEPLNSPDETTVFVIDDASGVDEFFFGNMSVPNVLAFGGYSPGWTGAGYGRFSSMHVSFEGLANQASVNIFFSSFDEIQDNQLNLQGFYEGALVGQAVLEMPDADVFSHSQMVLSGVLFDDLRLVATGPGLYGAVFISLDNFHISLVPEPATALLLGLGALMLRGCKKRK